VLGEGLSQHSLDFSTDLDAYHDYVRSSRAEFTVAKDQNVRLRTGWFSDRGAIYLASSRPEVTQDTGFGSVLPTGEALFHSRRSTTRSRRSRRLRQITPAHAVLRSNLPGSTSTPK